MKEINENVSKNLVGNERKKNMELGGKCRNVEGGRKKRMNKKQEKKKKTKNTEGRQR